MIKRKWSLDPWGLKPPLWLLAEPLSRGVPPWKLSGITPTHLHTGPDRNSPCWRAAAAHWWWSLLGCCMWARKNSKPPRAAHAMRVCCGARQEPEFHGNQEDIITWNPGDWNRKVVKNPRCPPRCSRSSLTRIREITSSFPHLPWLGYSLGLCFSLCVCPISSCFQWLPWPHPASSPSSAQHFCLWFLLTLICSWSHKASPCLMTFQTSNDHIILSAFPRSSSRGVVGMWLTHLIGWSLLSRARSCHTAFRLDDLGGTTSPQPRAPISCDRTERGGSSIPKWSCLIWETTWDPRWWAALDRV